MSSSNSRRLSAFALCACTLLLGIVTVPGWQDATPTPVAEGFATPTPVPTPRPTPVPDPANPHGLILRIVEDAPDYAPEEGADEYNRYRRLVPGRAYRVSQQVPICPRVSLDASAAAAPQGNLPRGGRKSAFGILNLPTGTAFVVSKVHLEGKSEHVWYYVRIADMCPGWGDLSQCWGWINSTAMIKFDTVSVISVEDSKLMFNGKTDDDLANYQRLYPLAKTAMSEPNTTAPGQ